MRKLITCFTCVVIAGLHFSAFAQNKLPTVVNAFPIASNGTWDFVTVASEYNKLYVSHEKQVNILNLTTGDSIGVIPNTTGVHGIALDKALKKGYTSNGKLNNVTVFDIETNKILNQIATGEKPDYIFYEPFSRKIIVCNGISNNMNVIDPVTDKIVATIAVGGKPELAVSDNNGNIFVNLEDKNEVVVIGMSSNKVLNHWSLSPGEAPTGLAFDKNSKRLFAGCENKMLVVMDATNGRVISHLPIGTDCDGVVFDNGTKTVYVANGGDGTVTAIKEQSPTEFKVLANLATKKSARTIGIDENTHTLYLPTADLESKITPGAKRPAMIPGTFGVLVLH